MTDRRRGAAAPHRDLLTADEIDAARARFDARIRADRANPRRHVTRGWPTAGVEAFSAMYDLYRHARHALAEGAAIRARLEPTAEPWPDLAAALDDMIGDLAQSYPEDEHLQHLRLCILVHDAAELPGLDAEARAELHNVPHREFAWLPPDTLGVMRQQLERDLAEIAARLAATPSPAPVPENG